jgi:hypothetical protein
VQQDLDIEEFTDPHNPMIPHTFVLEPGLRPAPRNLKVSSLLAGLPGGSRQLSPGPSIRSQGLAPTRREAG